MNSHFLGRDIAIDEMKALRWKANTTTGESAMETILGGVWLAIGKADARVCGVLLAAMCAMFPVPAKAEDVYTIAVIPSAPPVTLHAQWTPFLEHLTRESGLPFRLKLFQRMSEFEREIGDGTADFLFASPIQTVVAHQMHGYLPLVRGGKLVSIGLFVRTDSPATTMDELSKETISFAGNKNLCSVLVRHLLAEQKAKISYTSEYAGSTSNVIKSVLLGKSAAGAVFIPELEKVSIETREQLRLVAVTTDIAPHPLSAHPRVARTLREQVSKIVLKMASAKEGAELFKTLRLPAPVAADYERDYKSLELVDIKALTDWGK